MLSAIDWTAASAIAALVVAIATLILAIATLSLARSTTDEVGAVRREAEATEKQAAITARALAALSRPWLTADPGPIREAASGNQVPQVSLVDGVKVNYQAVIPKDSSRVWGREGPNSRDFSLTRFLFPRSSVLASGESTLLEFFVSHVALQDFIGSQFRYDFLVHVLYTDADGGQPTVASFRISAYPGRDPSVFEIAYRHLDEVPSLTDARVIDETEPFALVRLGLPE